MNPNILLIKSTELLLSLSKNPEWKNDLLSKAPPVLWFGNSSSKKPEIVTVGANPSRWEFLDKKKLSKYNPKKEIYENFYLPVGRFFHLAKEGT